MKLFSDPMWDRYFQPQGSGLYTSSRQFYSPGGPDDQPVPTSQTAAPETAVPVKVKVLSMWPFDPAKRSSQSDFFPAPKEDAILPQYRFGEIELGKMHGQILRTMLAWEETWRPYIRAALSASRDYDRAWDVAEGIKEHVDQVQAMLGPTIEVLLLAANNGLSASSKAFNEVTAELRAWPASSVPELIIRACIDYTEDWSVTTEAAAGRFKLAAKAWMDIQTRLVALFADERQLRAMAYEGQKTRAEDAEKRVRELELRVADLQRGSGLLDSIRENFEGVLKAGKDAANKALNAVGAALPSLAGGFGIGLVVLLGLAVAAFALKR
ncbi:hypothetical protein ANRL2_04024 [Anaerolineae bacterium]|nr:hypothetical protein ANRL2_04024 [Anaerolineae bacterium]